MEFFKKRLKESDPDVWATIQNEKNRQNKNLELIASENNVSMAVLEADGCIMTNKYAEGYPSRRYYGGCEFVDEAEKLAIERIKTLFNAKFANVQAHSGSQANMAAYMSLVKPGDTVMGMDLSHGGHLTHGHPLNFSGSLYNMVAYQVSPETQQIDYDKLREIAKESSPKMIIAGASAYPRFLDFKKFREICDEVGASLMVDIAHIGGQVATGLHPSPVPYADIVTGTTHKTLRGPRGGYLLTNNEDIAKKINREIFPGIQGGPLMHIIAAKAVAFGECLKPDYKVYMKNVNDNAKSLASALMERGFTLVSGGTDNHLMLVDVSKKGLTGKAVESALDKAAISANKNTIPFDPQKPMVTSGIRIGTPSLTTRGMGKAEMAVVAEFIKQVVENIDDDNALAAIRDEVYTFTAKYPMYE
ncbi:MAG: serine hydroxymethyltransferase [Spirochaetia bacterium]|jgi:glycine hydroxymethyltransferase|nr:serine hydroxymethyltransferase [Spirochaetia bacterium]